MGLEIFLRGLQPNYMDPYVEYDPAATLGCTQEQFDSARLAMGLTLEVASQINLVAMIPHNELSSTTYCLADPGSAYLVYLPDGDKAADVDWLQPCIRVNEFTNRTQENYIPRCFIFTAAGLTTLDKTRRTEEGFYKGGQSYIPPGIKLKDVNPRPISLDQPANGLIGCFSDDDKYLMATAWNHYQELFQGIFVCLQNCG